MKSKIKVSLIIFSLLSVYMPVSCGAVAGNDSAREHQHYLTRNLFAAIDEGSVEGVSMVLDEARRAGHSDFLAAEADDGTVDWKKLNKDGYTPLGLAAHLGHVDIVRFLHSSEFCPHLGMDLTKGKYEWSIVRAAARGLLRLTSMKTSSLTHSPIHIAARAGKTAVIVCLIDEYNVDINLLSPACRATPFCHAAAHGHLETLKALYERGSSLTCSSRDTFISRAYTPKTAAEYFGHAEVVEYIVQCEEQRERKRSL